MNRKGFAALMVVLMVVIVLVVVGGVWYYEAYHTNVRPDDFAVSIADDESSISITNNGTLIKSITPGDIPSFDLNDIGDEPADPALDYLFAGQFFLDTAHAIVYFSVYNASTAGNVNADRALFSYDIKNAKLTLLTKEQLSASFGIVEPSADGNFLVYSDGSHGGQCYDTLGLEVYDLKNATITADIFLPYGIGVIEFDHWIATTSFAYEEDTYSSVAACLQDGNSNPKVTQKVYVLK